MALKARQSPLNQLSQIQYPKNNTSSTNLSNFFLINIRALLSKLLLKKQPIVKWWDPSSCQVSWKSVEQFLWDPVDKLTSQPMNIHGQRHNVLVHPAYSKPLEVHFKRQYFPFNTPSSLCTHFRRINPTTTVKTEFSCVDKLTNVVQLGAGYIFKIKVP